MESRANVLELESRLLHVQLQNETLMDSLVRNSEGMINDLSCKRAEVEKELIRIKSEKELLEKRISQLEEQHLATRDMHSVSHNKALDLESELEKIGQRREKERLSWNLEKQNLESRIVQLESDLKVARELHASSEAKAQKLELSLSNVQVEHQSTRDLHISTQGEVQQLQSQIQQLQFDLLVASSNAEKIKSTSQEV
ncbi:hypothetical protein HDU99_002935, partial [Rhizoclosmatium hyalinum]